MNKILWFSLCIGTGFCQAQQRTYTLADMPFQIDSTTSGVVYKGTIDVPGASADQLYTRAKAFFWSAFSHDNQVIKVDDQLKGIVSGRGRLFLPMTNTQAESSSRSIYYEVPVEIRVNDAQYSYRIADIYIIENGKRTRLDNDIRANLTAIRQQVLIEEEYNRSIRSVSPFISLINQLKRRMKSRSKVPFHS